MPIPLFHVFSDDRFMDLTLYQYGYEKCRPLHSFGPSVRNHFLFHYIFPAKVHFLLTKQKPQQKNTSFTAVWVFSLNRNGSTPISPTEKIPGNMHGWNSAD